MAGSSSDAPSPPMIAQNTMIAVTLWATVIASAPIAYPSRPSTYARLRPKRSPTLLLIRMNAADTSASSAIALWTELTVVSRSSTTAEIDTFISEVSTTSTNIAAASTSDNRTLPASLRGSAMAPPRSGERFDRGRRSGNASSAASIAAQPPHQQPAPARRG